MKKVNIALRVLFGALFTWGALAFFLNLMPQPELTGDMGTFMAGLAASKYFFPLLKGTELICGLALLTGLFVPLAIVVLFPITVNIVCVHLFLAPEGMPMALIILLVHLYLAYSYKESYKNLFQIKN